MLHLVKNRLPLVSSTLLFCFFRENCLCWFIMQQQQQQQLNVRNERESGGGKFNDTRNRRLFRPLARCTPPPPSSPAAAAAAAAAVFSSKQHIRIRIRVAALENLHWRHVGNVQSTTTAAAVFFPSHFIILSEYKAQLPTCIQTSCCVESKS